MEGFYWLVEGVLAGCPRPGYRPRGRFSRLLRRGDSDRLEAEQQLDEDLSWLRGQRVGAVLSLTEEPLSDDVLRRHEFEVLHLPVPDLTAPSREQLQQALAFIDWQIGRGQGVVVHCLMGQGRTGTVLGAYLIRQGRPVEHALADVRAVCPGAVGSPAQERALEEFALRRDWIL